MASARGSSIAAPRWSWRARSSATRSTWWPGTRAIPRRSKKRSPSPEATPEGGTRPGDAGQGEAADLGDVAAGRRGGDPDAGERPAGDDRPADRSDDRQGDLGLHRRI